ncbi:MAG TPA: Ig-like domain-containing protein [Candidatus Dormibacteraeota bacterium]|nr:Ig-like domain-containing protein [Candidatus Dormibacteraeota bacterium]
MSLWVRFFGRRSVMIPLAAVVIVAIAAGVGVFLASRSHGLQSRATRNVGPAPSVAPAGSVALATPKQAVVLAVVKTVPEPGSSGIAVATPITLDFNLPVDPASVSSFLSVYASGGATPTVNGTLSQGASPEEVVFKPSTSFQSSATVQVVLRGGLLSVDGSALGTDYGFSFATVLSPRTVTFLSDWQIVRLVNAASGRPVNLTIQAGPGLSANVVLKTYRASVQDLLTAFVYGTSGYAVQAVDTSAMTPVDNGGTTMTASGARTGVVQDNVNVTVSQPDGLYVVVATDAAGQYGAVWVNFSRYAMLLRQDDQRVVVAGEDLTTGEATAQFAITFYNLLNGVHVKATGTFTGTAEYPAKYPSGFDLAVAQVAGETVIVPMGAPETNGDTRVAADLSQMLKVFLTTDRLAYGKGDTVRFAGAVRVSNDQVYSLGSGLKIAVWSYVTPDNLATATVAADGTFSGSFTIPAAAFNADGSDANLVLFAGPPSRITGLFFGYAATIVAAGPHSPAATVTVTLDKATYLAGDTIAASISGPASTTVNVAVYASQHPAQPAEFDTFSGATTWGEVVQSATSVKLDASGRGAYSFKANIPHKAADEEITLEATYGTGWTQAVGARTAIVYQAADEVYLLSGRTSYRQGDTVVAPFVVEARDGSRVPNASMSYELDSTDYSGSTAITTVVNSGTVTTDANGLGVIRTQMATRNAQVTLRVKGKDAAGNVFEDDLVLGFGGGVNARLDLSSDKVAYAPGDSAQLTVTSPTAETALVSLERGRVHQYRLVQLAKGDSALTVSVTADLAPGFNVVISYFQGGEYTSQVFPLHVNNSARLLKVKLTPDQPGYTKGQTAHVTIAVADGSGAAVAGSALVNAYDARMSAFKLVDKGSIAGAFLTPDTITTNGSSSLLGIGTYGGRCGGGYFAGMPDPTFAGQAVVWSPDVAIDASGHATVDVALSSPVRLVVFVGTPNSGWGQAEIDLNVQ